MNTLIAHIRSEYKNVLCQESNIINGFDSEQITAIEFTPNYRLDDDESFILGNLSQRNFFNEICNNNYSTASLSQISNSEYDLIEFIVILQGNQKLFQRITPSLFVNKRTILDYSGEPKIINQQKQIEVRQESDAVYFPDSDTLYFRNLSKIKAIFPGIEELYKEATHEEVDSFLMNDFILLSSEYTAESVGTQNRKRIADIIAKYNDLRPEKKQHLINYARSKAGLELDSDAIKINSDQDLKKLLYAMDQRYYYADIYEENRIANSIRVIDD